MSFILFMIGLMLFIIGFSIYVAFVLEYLISKEMSKIVFVFNLMMALGCLLMWVSKLFKE